MDFIKEKYNEAQTLFTSTVDVQWSMLRMQIEQLQNVIQAQAVLSNITDPSTSAAAISAM